VVSRMGVVCVLCMVRVGRVAHWVKGDLVGGLVAFCGWAGVWVLASKGGGCGLCSGLLGRVGGGLGCGVRVLGYQGRCGVGREGRPCPHIRTGAAGLVSVGFRAG